MGLRELLAYYSHRRSAVALVEMLDSVSPDKIPPGTPIVAGYVDGRYAWTAADWARFPTSVHVRIAVQATTNDGDVLDVEKGDATPTDAPGWVERRRAAKINRPPTVYTSLSNWQTCKDAFAAAKVAEPNWWIASWDGVANLASVPGAVAKQYQGSMTTVDRSVTNGVWPATPSPPAPAPTPEVALRRDQLTVTIGPDSQAAVACPVPYTKIVSVVCLYPGAVVTQVGPDAIRLSGAAAGKDVEVVVWSIP